MPKAKAKPKGKAAQTALAKFEESFAKTYGDGRLLTEHDEVPYTVVPTGSISLDLAMGVGGYVVGRISEIWGVDDIGKSVLAMHGIAEAQRMFPDRLAAWVDMEHKWDWRWARLHGVQTARDRFKLVVPESAEEVADQVKDLCRSGLFSIVNLDSIGAMIPEAEKEKDADEAVVANQAKIVTRMVKIATVEADLNDVAFVVINQVRANIAKFAFKTTTTGGGFALKHVTTHKVELKRGDTTYKVRMDGKDQEVGHKVACMVERNKVAPPKKRAEFSIFHTPSEKYGPPGIDRVTEAALVGIKTGVILKDGSWFTMPTGERLNGQAKVEEALRQDPSMIDEVRTLALATVGKDIIEDTEYDAEALAKAEEAEVLDITKAVKTGRFRGIDSLANPEDG